MDLNLEDMVLEISASADYRVLRRLVPQLNFDPQALGGDANGVVQVLVLDTETTGLDQATNKLIELALLRVGVDTRTGLPVGPVEVYDGLEDPGRPLPAEIVRLTGITDAMLSGQRLDEKRIGQMLAGADVVVAHNAGFDRPFAEARIDAFRRVRWACSWADVPWKAHGHASAKLETLAFDKGLFYDAHRAEMDCHALLAVLSQAPGPVWGVKGAVGGAVNGAGPSAARHETAMAHVLSASEKSFLRIEALGAPFETKDILKARGYRWDAQSKLWGTQVGQGDEFEGERKWLLEHVYANRPSRIRVTGVSPLDRFTARSSEQQIMVLQADR